MFSSLVKLFLVVSFAFSAAFFDAGASSKTKAIIGRDDREYIAKLSDYEANPYGASGKAATPYKMIVSVRSNTGLCSGALVGRDLVLTNHHCVEDNIRGTFTIGALNVASGNTFIASKITKGKVIAAGGNTTSNMSLTDLARMVNDEAAKRDQEASEAAAINNKKDTPANTGNTTTGNAISSPAQVEPEPIIPIPGEGSKISTPTESGKITTGNNKKKRPGRGASSGRNKRTSRMVSSSRSRNSVSAKSAKSSSRSGRSTTTATKPAELSNAGKKLADAMQTIGKSSSSSKSSGSRGLATGGLTIDTEIIKSNDWALI